MLWREDVLSSYTGGESILTLGDAILVSLPSKCLNGSGHSLIQVSPCLPIVGPGVPKQCIHAERNNR